MRKLVIDQISNQFDYKKDYALGAWCFDKNLSLEKIIKKKINKNIIENRINQIKAFKCCEEQYSRIIKKIAFFLRKENNLKFSLNFFEHYVGYWLLDFIHLAHYSKRLSNTYKKTLKDQNLQLIIKFKTPDFHFLTTDDYLQKTHKNPYIFSHFVLKFLLKNKPKKWKVKRLSNNYYGNLKLRKSRIFSSVKNFFSNIIFSRVKHVSGFNKFEKFLLSLILTFIKPKIKYNKLNNFQTLIKKSKLKPPVSDKELIDMVKEFIPKSYFQINKNKFFFLTNCNNRVMLCSSSSLINDDKKYIPLLFKELGGKIISVQHGSAYGDASISIHHGHEYLFDKFISWGQKNHENYKVRFIPLPSPQLRQKMNYDKIKHNHKILFVSTSNVFFQRKYIKMRSFDESCLRIKNSYEFLKNLNKKNLSKILYKDSNYGHFSEKTFLKRNFKKMKFINKIPENYVEDSKLIVMNNYSTFFFKALSMNIPTILFCKKNCWGITKKAQKLFEILHKVEIIHYDPKLAAKKLDRNIFEWWYSNKTQKARKLFCNEFALNDSNTFKVWLRYFTKNSYSP